MADRDPMPDSQVGGGEGRGGRDSKANMARASVAELTGTAILVFVGTVVATGAILARPTAGDPYDSLTGRGRLRADPGGAGGGARTRERRAPEPGCDPRAGGRAQVFRGPTCRRTSAPS